MDIPNQIKPSRRDLIAGGAAVALATAIPRAVAETTSRSFDDSTEFVTQGAPKRYGASAAYLTDGRIMVTGGYDQLPRDDAPLRPLTTAYILDPTSGLWYSVTGLRLARAQHATVALANGRVAVIGGLGTSPLGSVEIYDPRLDRWEFGPPLAQPRYGHTAVSDGNGIIVMGGLSTSIISQVEILSLRRAADYFKGNF